MMTLWNRFQRRLDRHILWPECKKMADGDVTDARSIFMIHMTIDRAYRGWSDKKMIDYLRTLK